MKINRLFIIPLSAVAFLVGCKPTPTPTPSTVTVKLTFNVDGTTLAYGDKTYEPSDKPIEIQIPSGTTTNYVKFAIIADEEEEHKPSDLLVSKTDGDVYSDYVFDNNSGELIINLNSDLTIAGQNYRYKSLKELTWAQISAISAKGDASHAFTIGDTKDVYLLEDGVEQESPHKVRIIDFDHDTYNVSANETKDVSITFEFVNVITKNDNSTLDIKWDNTNNYDFKNSILNKALNDDNGDFYKMVPEDLKSVVKTVNKKYIGTSSYTSSNYTPKFFPLAAVEITGFQSSYKTDDGSVYWYYEHDYNQQVSPIRKKTVVDSVESTSYWLRSPATQSAAFAGKILSTGGIVSGSDVKDADAIAPAFVI